MGVAVRALQVRALDSTHRRETMARARQTQLRSIPSVESVLQDSRVQAASEGILRAVAVDAVRAAVREVRERLSGGAQSAGMRPATAGNLEEVRDEESKTQPKRRGRAASVTVRGTEATSGTGGAKEKRAQHPASPSSFADPPTPNLLRRGYAGQWATEDKGLRRTGAAPLQEMMDEESVRRAIIELALERIKDSRRPFYRHAINASGIILHTGLGRAVLSPNAVRQIAEELSGYSVLQIDVESGERSKRDGRIEELLVALTGAEAATVVNNNSAATSIVLNTLAKGKEVIVSRGQLVEIGGSFRLPEVMEASGARLVEVGTTNKTHAKDYEKAITENTGAILRVHPSNYRIYGFTSEVGLAELAAIAHAHKLPLVDDVGSGALIDFARFGFPDEPTLRGSIKAGADVVLSSADKLIGASQGGIILGRAEIIAAIRKNPLARMMRVGKLTLAALEATLALFRDEETALREVPTLAMLVKGKTEIAAQAGRMRKAIAAGAPGTEVETLDGNSQMGSGSLPTENLPTRLVSISPKGMTPDELALALRRNEPPIVARIQKDRVLLDPRTILAGEEETVVEAVVAILAGNSSQHKDTKRTKTVIHRSRQVGTGSHRLHR